jgi:hypothetical protein
MGTQQRLEQGFPCREMTKQGCQAHTGAAGDIAHRGLGAMLGDDVTRDREDLIAIFFGVGSHKFP